jgi:hypothetical protein
VSGTPSPGDQIRTAVDRFYRLVLADRQLGPRFAGVDVRRLRMGLSSVLINALHDPGRTWPAELIAAHRALGLTGDDYDLLGHYLLSTLLPLRLGTDLLVRVGAILTDARAEVVDEVRARRAAPRRGVDEVRARRAAPRRGPVVHCRFERWPTAMTSGHLPATPGWSCRDCGDDWPCPVKRSQLLAEFHGASVTLGQYLGGCFVDAAQDLVSVPAARLRTRFLGWAPWGLGKL